MYLRDKWGKMDLADIAKAIGKTSNSCRQKAIKLGLAAKALENDLSHHNQQDKASRPANKQELLFMGWVVEQGCIVPRCNKPANFHHERFKSQGGNHKSGCGLCKFHHQDGKQGRHAMSMERFNITYKIDILAIAEGNWSKYENKLRTQINVDTNQ